MKYNSNKTISRRVCVSLSSTCITFQIIYIHTCNQSCKAVIYYYLYYMLFINKNTILISHVALFVARCAPINRSILKREG